MADESERWWVINGAELHAALARVEAGETPAAVYVELWANSTTEAESVPTDTPADAQRQRERQRWADAIDLRRREWREGPNTPEAGTAISILGDVMNCLRFNEPEKL